MNGDKCIEGLSKSLFWDMDIAIADMSTCPEQLVQRVFTAKSIRNVLLFVH